MKEIYLAGGCFWGTQHFLSLLPGVSHSVVGFANSIIPSPSYKEVCTGATGAAETVKTVYDPTIISLRDILNLYFLTIDPLSINRQGGDHGTQYRTGIYWTDPADEAIVKEALTTLAATLPSPPVIEAMPLLNFYPAEDYHQDYLVKNPQGYCHLSPALFDLARSFRPTK
ncbi:MAG: peptide-methionine (S)-S-oxide reductase MsrA [Alloprevotella sp.]|nr:peptide-methionine (S)-S-oxide reductase MsrA [Alloprevotella sp.]